MARESNAVVPIPDEWDVVTAAAVPLAAPTAIGAFQNLRRDAGDTLLLVGTTGGVGSIVVHMAALRGIHVNATRATWVFTSGPAESM